ncbi:histone H2AX-like [Cetorhinus maximus]
MFGRDKTGEKGRAKATAHSFSASLQFHVGSIHRLLHEGHYAERVRGGASVYLAAVLKYLTAEILQLASNAAWGLGQQGDPVAIHNDEEPNKMLGGVTIAQGGALASIQAVLLPKKTGHSSKVYA